MDINMKYNAVLLTCKKKYSLESNLHDVCLMNSGNTGSLVVSGVFKCVLCDTLTCGFCDELNALHNSVYNLTCKFNKRDTNTEYCNMTTMHTIRRLLLLHYYIIYIHYLFPR